MVRTAEDIERAYDQIMLRFQWFALGIAATCILVALSLPGYWQSSGMMLAVALAIGFLRGRRNRWREKNRLHEKPVIVTLTARNTA